MNYIRVQCQFPHLKNPTLGKGIMKKYTIPANKVSEYISNYRASTAQYLNAQFILQLD
jgi:hypothetical protein